jgi:hypothetical protein
MKHATRRNESHIGVLGLAFFLCRMEIFRLVVWIHCITAQWAIHQRGVMDFALTLTFHFLCGFGWHTAHITHMGGGNPTTNARGGRGFDMGGSMLFMQRQIEAVYRVSFLFQGAQDPDIRR